MVVFTEYQDSNISAAPPEGGGPCDAPPEAAIALLYLLSISSSVQTPGASPVIPPGAVP